MPFPSTRLLRALAALVVASGCAPPSVTPTSVITAPKGSGTAAWERLRSSLPGSWTMPGKKGPFTVSYKLISGDSALVETWGVGSGQETMTVFHPDHEDLVLTHYCAQGNQPRLRVAAVDDGAVVFRFADATNAGPGKAVLIERTLRFRQDAFDDTEVYEQPDGAKESTTYHFTRAGQAPPTAHHHGPLVHRFEGAEQWAKEFDDPARDAWQRPGDVIAAMRVQTGMTVVDLGAGTGYFLPHLSRAVGPSGRVLALDVEPDMVRYMKERAAREHLANVTPSLVPLDEPGLPARSVDRVLVVDTWHHIDGRPAYAAKLLAALAPGGAVFVVDFKLEASHGPPREHRLAPEQVAAELTQGGLVAEIVVAPLPEQYIVVGRKP